MPQRIETGAVVFGEDWPGVFIRGDDAFNYAIQLAHLLDVLHGSEDPIVLLALNTMDGLRQLLLSCEVRPEMDVLKLKDAQSCLPPV